MTQDVHQCRYKASPFHLVPSLDISIWPSEASLHNANPPPPAPGCSSTRSSLGEPRRIPGEGALGACRCEVCRGAKDPTESQWSSLLHLLHLMHHHHLHPGLVINHIVLLLQQNNIITFCPQSVCYVTAAAITMACKKRRRRAIIQSEPKEFEPESLPDPSIASSSKEDVDVEEVITPLQLSQSRFQIYLPSQLSVS